MIPPVTLGLPLSNIQSSMANYSFHCSTTVLKVNLRPQTSFILHFSKTWGWNVQKKEHYTLMKIHFFITETSFWCQNKVFSTCLDHAWTKNCTCAHRVWHRPLHGGGTSMQRNMMMIKKNKEKLRTLCMQTDPAPCVPVSLYGYYMIISVLSYHPLSKSASE